MRRGRLQCLEELLGPHVTILARGVPQAGRFVGSHGLPDASEDLLAALGQLVEVVDEIDEQEFRRELSRERRLHAKVELPATQREFAVTLVIIDDGSST